LRSQLSWTQYKLLIRIGNQDKRTFYIAESVKNNWTSRQLERQINSHLYERLLMSNNKESVLAVATNEKLPSDAKEIIKDPIYLEFIGLKREAAYYEKDIEKAIITHLQDFLLELGNGFSFVARQKRIHIEGDDFFINLVFYNRLLQCFVLIEMKTSKLTHQDIGQLQMYVNYYDRTEKMPTENPTIGILLCSDKNDAVVKFTLPEHSKNIIASQYKLYLPTEQQLLEEVNKELSNFINHKGIQPEN
jgi:predicted nuclease of restriction endonuclease-like (RecB) superfamily